MDSIRVPGPADEVDSFAACVTAVLRHWGQEVAYDCVAGLSGSAFSPVLNEGEPCAAWWMESGADGRVEFMGQALGFAAESVAEVAAEGEVGRALCRARVLDALETGGAVLCGSLPCWSLVTRWDDDPARLGLLPPAGLRCAPRADRNSPIYVLRPAERCLTRCEAMREALHFGARAAAGEAARGGFGRGAGFYDAWLARMQQDEFCPACAPNGWRCAERSASRTRSGQLSAAHFLQRASSLLPDVCDRGFADRSAETYALMAETLRPYTVGMGLQQTWGDARWRGRYMQDLVDVRDLHRIASHFLGAAAATA